MVPSNIYRQIFSFEIVPSSNKVNVHPKIDLCYVPPCGQSLFSSISVCLIFSPGQGVSILWYVDPWKKCTSNPGRKSDPSFFVSDKNQQGVLFCLPLSKAGPSLEQQEASTTRWGQYTHFDTLYQPFFIFKQYCF